jgi:superfamily II DNA or RNA helicase
MEFMEIVDDMPEPAGTAGTAGTAVSSMDPLADLLNKCKGKPIPCASIDDLKGAPTRMYTLDGPKLQSDIKALGGVYWVSKEALLKPAVKAAAAANGLPAKAGKAAKKAAAGALQPFAEPLVLEPQAAPGQWAPKIRCFYDHPTRDDVIGVPRFWGLSVFGAPEKDIRVQGLPLSYMPKISLRDLQVRAVDQTLQSLEVYGGASVIADCGFGKTRLAMGLASALGRKTLILCNREVLMLQWAAVVKDLTTWSISWLQGADSITKASVKVGTGPDAPRFPGASVPADVCIGSIDTLLEGNVPREILETFGTVIVDEAHHLAAATLVHALPLVPARYVVGLSATPDRRDGLEHALYWLAGPASFVYKRLPSITGIHGAVAVHKVVPAGTANREKMYANGQLAFAEMTTALSEDPRRNKYILDAIVDSLAGAFGAPRRKIIVVSALVGHCVALRDAMAARSATAAAPEAPLRMALMAGPNVETVAAKDPSTQVVFATYAMLEEGYDDPVLDTLILATPRSRVQQTVGRIERSHEGKLRPLVIDIADGFSIYPSMWFKRAHFYKSRGFTIETKA